MMKILVLMFLSVLYGVPYDGLTLITDIGQAGQGGGSGGEVPKLGGGEVMFVKNRAQALWELPPEGGRRKTWVHRGVKGKGEG